MPFLLRCLGAAVAPSFEMRVERLTVTEGRVASLALVLEPDTYKHTYHGYLQILQLLTDIAKKHPNTTHLYRCATVPSPPADKHNEV